MRLLSFGRKSIRPSLAMNFKFITDFFHGEITATEKYKNLAEDDEVIFLWRVLQTPQFHFNLQDKTDFDAAHDYRKKVEVEKELTAGVIAYAQSVTVLLGAADLEQKMLLLEEQMLLV